MIEARRGTAGLAARLTERIAWLLRGTLVAAIAVMLGCIAIQVVMRYVFGITPIWSEELAILMFAWATLGGFALGVREGFHVRLTALIEPLPAGLRGLADRALDALATTLGAYLVWAGWRYVDVTRGSTSAAIQYPIELLHGLAPVAGALVFVFALERLLIGAPAATGPADDGEPAQ
jgi:TRAP-type C4-dicarboxylate transport system permease small subunit